MRYRVIAAVVAALALGVVVATTASASTKTSHTLTVWLQVDAQSGWPGVVAAANTAFENANPGWTVNVQYQTWGDAPPEVRRHHRRQRHAGRHRDGQHRDDEVHGSGRVRQPHGKQVAVRQLVALARRPGEVVHIQQQALRRSVLRRLAACHVPHRPLQEGGSHDDSRRVSAASSRFSARSGRREAKVKGFSPLYVAGNDWYTALSFVFDYGGDIATLNSKGKWVGTLDSAKSIAGLNAFKKFFLAYSPHSAATLNEANPAPYAVYSSTPVGHAAAIFGPGWYSCCEGNYTKVSGQFVMPSHVSGKAMPGFLGGSDLAVPKQGTQQAQARAWIGDFTDTTNEKALQAKGDIPNATNLLDNSINDQAAEQSWFVPTGEVLGRRREREHRSVSCSPRSSRGSTPSSKPRRSRTRTSSTPSTSPNALSGRAPSMGAAAEAVSTRPRRRPLTWRQARRGSVPYLLIFPVLAVMAAILGYPLYQLIRLALREIRAARADRPQGHLRRVRELHERSPRRGSSGTRCCAPSSSPSPTSG